MNISIKDEHDEVVVIAEIGRGVHDVQMTETTTLTRTEVGLIPEKVHQSNNYISESLSGNHINDDVINALREDGETVIVPPKP